MTNRQTTFLALGVAIVASAATVATINAFDRYEGAPLADTRLSTGKSDSFLTPVVNRPPTNTDFTKAAESTVEGVVSVKSFATPRSNPYNNGYNGYVDPFEFFFGVPQQRQQPRQRQQQNSEPQQTGLGSGVIISSDGYIVTNNHVVDGAEILEITLNDNRNFTATIIGTDPSTDLALIKIDATDLSVIPMGDSDALKVGEWVLAVGNPFGFTSTVTTGIVSAKARSISSATHAGRSMGIESYIQTDAAVNPGNSGGALVNLNGELMGINTAIYSQTGNYAGYSFAVPVSIVRKVVTDLKEYGAVQRAVLGVTFTEITPELLKKENITSVNDGVYVVDVVDHSSAMEAGLKAGDIIVAIDSAPIRNGAQLQEQLARKRPGDKINIGYVRDGERKTANVTLLNNQGSTKITSAGSSANLGCTFQKLDEATCRQLRIQSGLKVVDLKDGFFKRAGIREGFIILDINNSRVKSSEDVEKLYQAIMKSDEYDKVMFITGIYSSGQRKYYAVDLVD